MPAQPLPEVLAHPALKLTAHISTIHAIDYGIVSTVVALKPFRDRGVMIALDDEGFAPVGWTARASDTSHHLVPDLTERSSGDIAGREIKKAAPLAPHSGALHTPMAEGTTIDGGIRNRMRAEDGDRAMGGTG
jgi:hypothetical protein